jgi:hypothetical protein
MGDFAKADEEFKIREFEADEERRFREIEHAAQMENQDKDRQLKKETAKAKPASKGSTSAKASPQPSE